MGARLNTMAPAKDTAAPTVVVRPSTAQERPAFDAYVARHPAATPYHLNAWLEAVERAYGHRVHLLVARAADGKTVGLLPLCEVRVPFGRPSLVSQPFCDLGGPLADNSDVEAKLFEAAQSLMEQQRAGVLSLRLAGPAIEEKEATGPAPKVSMLCDLPESADALFKSYKPKLRSQIRKAEKNGLTARVLTNGQGVEDFYPVFAANMHRLGSPVHSLGWFQALQKAYGEQMLIGLVYYGQTVVGAGIVLLNGARASIPWASTLAEYNHLAPNMLLYWALLSHVTERGCQVFDFGRSSLGEGTYRFKKQWGAVPHQLNWVDYNSRGEALAEHAEPSATKYKLRTLVETLWQRLPLSMANRIGPLVRKYITL